MSNLSGKSLGQYRIIEQIGMGGMATVYKAFQPSLDRHVAIKVLSSFYAQQPNFSERFKREAKAIASLNHPNILPVYDFGQEEDITYIVMRHIEGALSLKEAMSKPIGVDQIADLIGQTAAALDYAHNRGIVHRDVKPSNVLMDGDWLLLSDFGLAKMVEGSTTLTETGVGMGTPAYMSPEQSQGISVDHRTDIYALGIILFEMLTGKIPHDSDTPYGIIVRRLSEPLPLPRTLNPNIPESLERVTLKALADTPDDRYSSAGELATALTEDLKSTEQVFSDDQPTIASPMPRTSTDVPIDKEAGRADKASPPSKQEAGSIDSAAQGQTWSKPLILAIGCGIVALIILALVIINWGETPVVPDQSTPPVTAVANNPTPSKVSKTSSLSVQSPVPSPSNRSPPSFQCSSVGTPMLDTAQQVGINHLRPRRCQQQHHWRFLWPGMMTAPLRILPFT